MVALDSRFGIQPFAELALELAEFVLSPEEQVSPAVVRGQDVKGLRGNEQNLGRMPVMRDAPHQVVEGTPPPIYGSNPERKQVAVIERMPRTPVPSELKLHCILAEINGFWRVRGEERHH